jgi:hypothetical protein
MMALQVGVGRAEQPDKMITLRVDLDDGYNIIGRTSQPCSNAVPGTTRGATGAGRAAVRRADGRLLTEE